MILKQINDWFDNTKAGYRTYCVCKFSLAIVMAIELKMRCAR